MLSKKSIPIIITLLLFLILLGYFLITPLVERAGDIGEYYGITETFITHFGFDLHPENQLGLSELLDPYYYNSPYYYILGRDGGRYPVHFIFYSLLLIPIRLILQFFTFNPLLSFSVTNLLILFLTILYIITKLLQEDYQKYLFLVFTLLSPVMFFIVWPGPDVFYICMLLLGIFFFCDKKYIRSSMFVALASWHSQPLIIICGAILAFYFFSNIFYSRINSKILLHFDPKVFISCVLVGLFALIPYFYNLFIFGMLTPWNVLADGWTVMNGFGIQNVSLLKLFEMFFDLNIGVFWYMPILFILFIIGLFKRYRNLHAIYLTSSFLITCFFYQTNPAWHYGTSGFGPTRHVLFMIPLIIYIALQVKLASVKYLVISLIIGTQLVVLSMNGFLKPHPPNSLYHNPMASFILNTWPQFYNPSYELFVDRTNHTDNDYLSNAFYKASSGKCKKAFVLIGLSKELLTTCGYIPEFYKQSLDDPFSRKASYDRSLWVKQATFWPDNYACTEGIVATKERPFVCMRSIEDVIKYTGFQDTNRLQKPANLDYIGVWELKFGSPVLINVPAGYVIQYFGQKGVYVNY